MNEFSNTEDIIQFDKNAYVRITDSQFEYHCGVLNDYEFIILIENIRGINFKHSRLNTNNRGCNIFISFMALIINVAGNTPDPSDVPIVDGPSESKNAILTLRYKTDTQKRWVSRDISWPGLTKAKADKIIRILKMRNKNLS